MQEAYFTRHSLKPDRGGEESERYPGLSPKGVELAKERARQEIAQVVEKADVGSVIFIGGASDMLRTKSTAEIYGDELENIAAEGNLDALVITREQIQQIEGGAGSYNKTLKRVINLIGEHRDKKIVVDFPLFLRGLSLKEKGWFDDKGDLSVMELVKKHNWNESEAAREWLETKGMVSDSKMGPDPKEVARHTIEEINRLRTFGQKYLGNRPIIPFLVGHSWALDALLWESGDRAYLDNGTLKETELVGVKINPTGELEIEHGDQTFLVDQDKIDL